jgi:hypothetical protein
LIVWYGREEIGRLLRMWKKMKIVGESMIYVAIISKDSRICMALSMKKLGTDLRIFYNSFKDWKRLS